MEKEVVKSDVLVIGSGGAGLRTAMELHDKGVDVLVIGKCKRRDAHTILATGGINAALGNMDKKDSWQLHAADTIKDGEHINDSIAVEILCKNAAQGVNELVNWGCPFHREKNGRVSQRFFGAATYRRACFVGDHTGKAILNALVDQTLKRKIRMKSEVYIVSLLTSKGKVNGALGIDIRSGKFVVFHSKLVVLCTGGHSRMFKRSSSRFWENNGDGIYLAYEVGAKFMDMEMFQFHPTGMVWPPEAEGVLVTEAVRGEGGILTNTKGERFMDKYDPERMELSARDIVARSIYNEIKSGRGTKRGGVLLDITQKPKSYILKRLPKMYKQFKKYAKIDISKEKMEVAPTAHYSMGGVYVDHTTGKTSVKNLFAVGEVTSGVHGGNRLGGNSLAELIVFGRLTGNVLVKETKKEKLLPLDKSLIGKRKKEILKLMKSNSGKDPVQVKKELQQVMWKGVGVVRNKNGMDLGLRSLERYKKLKFKNGKSMKMNEKLIAALDVRNMLPTCEMIVKSALFRKESRAAHYRSDYPKLLSKWKRNVVCTVDSNGKIKISTRKVPVVPKGIAKFLTNRVSDSKAHHMLE
jgi:succinate dehydrogenase / fumarate reductase, flavoprotein subunit